MSDLSLLASVGLAAILAASPPLLAGDALFGGGNNVFGVSTKNEGRAGWILGLANGELVFLAHP